MQTNNGILVQPGSTLAMFILIRCRSVELRLCLSCVSRDGIHFAFEHPEEGLEQDTNVNFLEILSEFSVKLLPEDRSKL